MHKMTVKFLTRNVPCKPFSVTSKQLNVYGKLCSEQSVREPCKTCQQIPPGTFLKIYCFKMRPSFTLLKTVCD